MQLLKRSLGLNKTNQNNRNNNIEVIGEKELKEATKFIQEIITDSQVWGKEVVTKRQELLENTQAGDFEAKEITIQTIQEILDMYGVIVKEYSIDEAARKIYSYAWGLDVIEGLYHDPTIDEIRVNSPEQVFIQQKGKNKKTDIKFKDEEHVKKILSRLFVHDRGVALTTSTPVVESIRQDGTRITATCPPATKNCTMVLRKHGTFEMTEENLIKAGTADQKTLNLLETLIKGRANILISGGTGTGKTSLLRYLITYMDPSIRIVTLETDTELRLLEHYRNRDIVEMEEHPEIGLTMNKQFRTVLRYSPDIIIVGEIRGRGEATEAIKACVRGHDGSMATIHFSSPEEAIEGCGKMMLEEGLNLPLEIASHWVASAFNIVIQMFTDTKRGIKKITKITEIRVVKNKIEYIDLIRWVPSEEDFFKGNWIAPNSISTQLLEKMSRYTKVQNQPLFPLEACRS